MGARNPYVPLLQPPTTPLPSVGLFSPDDRMGGEWSLCSFFVHRTHEARNPTRTPSFFLFIVNRLFFLFLFFFKAGRTPCLFFPGKWFPLIIGASLGVGLIKAQAAARVWATGHFGWLLYRP